MTATRTYDLGDARADHPLWFAPDATRFFGTRMGRVYVGPGFCYAVTSEQPPYGPRTFNVRRFSRTDCDTVGPDISEGWGTRTRAQSVARTLRDAETDGWLRRIPYNGMRPCKACDGDHPMGATYAVDHPTDPGLSGSYCGSHIVNTIGYAPLENPS